MILRQLTFWFIIEEWTLLLAAFGSRFRLDYSDVGLDSSDDDYDSSDTSSTISPVNKAKVSPEVSSSIVSLTSEAEVSPFNMTLDSSGGTEVASSIVNDTDMSIHKTLSLADTLKAFQAPWMSGP